MLMVKDYQDYFKRSNHKIQLLKPFDTNQSIN